MADRVVTASINAALRERYAAPAWSLLFNVGDATGARHTRFADAVAMSLWPSRGLDLHGFEVKASRADWRKELETPQKAEAIASFCDYWWLVSAAGAAKAEEIPQAWGWLEFADGKLVRRKEAVRTEAAPMTRTFLGALLRRAGEADDALVKLAVDKLREEDVKRVERDVKWQVETRTRNYQELLQTVDDFEKASGVKLGEWVHGDIGAAVKLVNDLGLVKSYGPIFQVAEAMAKASETLRSVLDANGIAPPEAINFADLTRRKRA